MLMVQKFKKNICQYSWSCRKYKYKMWFPLLSTESYKQSWVQGRRASSGTWAQWYFVWEGRVPDFIVSNSSSPQMSLSVTWPWVMRACLVFVKILLGALKGTLPTTYYHGALEISGTPWQAGKCCWWAQNYGQLLV